MPSHDWLNRSSVAGSGAHATSLSQLLNWLDNNGLNGYDPYDALNARRMLWLLRSGFARLSLTQFLKLWPFNWRPCLGIDKGHNPKAMGLFLKSYVKLYRLSNEVGYLDKAVELKNWLRESSSPGYAGYCWGYNFPWQTFVPWRTYLLLKANEPTIVNTAFISGALLDLYEVTHDGECLEMADSSCNFILKDLNLSEKPEGTCFSYTPSDRNLCHNANLLGAVLLARVHSLTGRSDLLPYARRAFDFTLFHQREDGSWNYSIHPITGVERRQIDFHQGFILDCILDFISLTNPSDHRYRDALLQGARFYRAEQFLPDGRAKWRYPTLWPVDIHNQAQGIITFSRLSEVAPEYLDVARVVAQWTVQHMQHASGYFYYQKWPFFTNKIPYIRWGQAWMMLALTTLLETLDGVDRRERKGHAGGALQ